MWRKLGETGRAPARSFFFAFFPSLLHLFSRMRPQHGPMNPELRLALLGAITVFFWLVAQAWTLLVLWAEGCATRPARPGATPEEKTP
jgi:hypothetical protein